MFGHARPICIDLLVAPEVLRIAGGPEVARVNGLRALLADMDAAFLRVARRCQRGHGERQCKRSRTFLQVHHDESPCYCRLATDTSRRRRRTRLLAFAAKRLPCRELMRRCVQASCGAFLARRAETARLNKSRQSGPRLAAAV